MTDSEFYGARLSMREFERECLKLACEREHRVYMLQCRGLSGPIKIGYAKRPEARLAHIRMHNPFNLFFVGMFRGGRALEMALHERFASSRIHGEWFKATPELIALGWA